MRLDKKLVDLGIKSRSKAKILISLGLVKVNGKVIKKSSYDVKPYDTVTFENINFVSRGFLKLMYFIEELKSKYRFDFKNKLVLDVGVSTGGFSQFFLHQGAIVYGIDVKNVVDKEILKHKNFHFILGNILEYRERDKFDFAITDVSNIPLEKYIYNVLDSVKQNGYIFSLLKPAYYFSERKRVKPNEALEIAKKVKDNLKGVNVLEIVLSKLQGKANNLGSSEVWFLIKK